MCEAWPTLEHVFSSGGVESTGANIYTGGRLPHDLLDKQPVDMLVVERGHFYKPPAPAATDQRS